MPQYILKIKDDLQTVFKLFCRTPWTLTVAFTFSFWTFQDFEIEDEITVKDVDYPDEDGIMTNQPLDSFLNNRPIIGIYTLHLYSPFL